MTPGTYLTKKDENNNKLSQYMNLVGSLRYAIDCTQPDICYTTGQLVRYLQKPNITHHLAAKHCFQYLNGTKHYWLILGGRNNINI